ncbi:hypothetical protein UFOVP247_163 [uncultured Caudovirales phage]|uniref:Uncharacterized protein n=1 Tax=uncultured Caudovirales phage TaxID=2100421 RepID=A0A6J7WX52_9CAUD|nr:hypothetical protein UFOVP247_163 [uncultured Caudovirales phage]
MENLESTHDRRQGFSIDDYVVLFPHDDFIEETEDGSISVLVDIYRKVDNNMVKVENHEVTEELQNKIQDYIERMISSAAEVENPE